VGFTGAEDRCQEQQNLEADTALKKNNRTASGWPQIQNEIKIKRGKQHTYDLKMKFSIENQQEYNRSADVTTLPPSF
jgi:hypothetical protein